MEKIKQNSPYKPIKQKPYCCVPACLMMVLERKMIKHGSQEEIGYELGLVVPKDKAKYFVKVRNAIKKPNNGWGTSVRRKNHSINDYFLRHNINLKEIYYPPKTIREPRELIVENLQKGNDIIACFNNKKLYGKGNYGHVSLVQKINDDIITLVDPDNKPSIRKVKLVKLIEAFKYHGKIHKGGFWIIAKNELILEKR